MSELQLITMFCDIDDFCKHFAPLFPRPLLHAGHRHRTRRTEVALSEIMTILVYFHSSHYRTFKHYYTKYVEPHLRPYFPTLVRYTRCVELIPRALVPLCCSVHTRKGRCTGIACIDSTPLAVCHNRRIWTHKVFAGWATRGKTSMGWFHGFKLYVVVNDEGDLLAFCLTRAMSMTGSPCRNSLSSSLASSLAIGGISRKCCMTRSLPKGENC